MTNAFYITDALPLKENDTPKTDFESALCDYFAFYSPSRTGELVSRLKKHDFTSVKAHFIASVPGKFEGNNTQKWGLGLLKTILKDIPTHPNTELFAQVTLPLHKPFLMKFSSVGLLGKTDTWLGPQFPRTLATTKSTQPRPPSRLIYPTLKNIQHSLNGYRSGSTIHWTITSPTHTQQEAYMR